MERNQGKERPKKKGIGAVGEDMMACRVNKNTVSDREG